MSSSVRPPVVTMRLTIGYSTLVVPPETHTVAVVGVLLEDSMLNDRSQVTAPSTAFTPAAGGLGATRPDVPATVQSRIAPPLRRTRSPTRNAVTAVHSGSTGSQTDVAIVSLPRNAAQLSI